MKLRALWSKELENLLNQSHALVANLKQKGFVAQSTALDKTTEAAVSGL